jgi:uroporphyrinogen-III synthase
VADQETVPKHGPTMLVAMTTAPLAGYTIGVTGDRRWEEQAEMLARRGATVVHGPVMRTSLLEDAEVTRAATERALEAPIDLVVLTTGIGTRSWFGVAESFGLDERLREVGAGATVVARGPKARSAALGNGLEVHWQAPGETSAEVLDHVRARSVAGQRVVVQRDGGDARLAEAISALGADVVDVPVYRWRLPEDPAPARRLLEQAVSGRLHALTFTCAYAVGNAFALADDPDGLRAALDGPAIAMSVGPVTTAALRAHGVESAVEPGRARLGAMVQRLTIALSEQHRVLRLGSHEARWQGDLVVHGDGSEVLLAPREARVLDRLVARAPAVVPKADLVVGDADDHAAETAVARLRSKLGPLGEGIRSVPRRGYASALDVTAP